MHAVKGCAAGGAGFVFRSLHAAAMHTERGGGIREKSGVGQSGMGEKQVPDGEESFIGGREK